MLHQNPLGEDLIESIRRSLAPGEQFIQAAEVFQEISQQYWNDFYKQWQNVLVGLTWQTLVLTNINIRFVQFEFVSVKTGFLSSEMRATSKIVFNHAIPIDLIDALGISTVTPYQALRKSLKKALGEEPGEITHMQFSFSGSTYHYGSPFHEFASLAQNLQNARAGISLAKQSGSISEAIEKLSELYREGMLSEEEFERAKAGYVGSTIEVVESSASLIRQLYQLVQAGVLSEGEFRIKKHDILSRPN